MKRLRCAIYTRKSSEEGLDQNFNSLDAQREACAAYILSQAGEGWTALPALYDDGGYSGGSMERPALKRLLADVAARKVDVVVVYKVDRLTRALTDFARIVDILDAAKTSFVSVTQAFNTTTSMGRLTLNVLLSFAQFEREVTGERIRDKFAASKAKGLWMGGNVPLGYDVKERALHVNEPEAALVQRIYDRYLELGSVPKLVRELETDGARTKSWISGPGRQIGGRVFSTRHVTDILKSRLYRGEIAHRGKIHSGAHAAIIAPDVWDAVQDKLSANATRGGSDQTPSAHLLTGLIFDDAGNAMSPTHAKKGELRYHYYCSAALLHDRRGVPGSIPRLPAPATDQAVRETIGPLLASAWRPGESLDVRVQAAIMRVEISAGGLFAFVSPSALQADPLRDQEQDAETIAIQVSGPVRKRRGAVFIDAKMPACTNVSLVRAIALARHWADALASGEMESVRAIARRHGLCHLYVGKLLPLAYLAPDLVGAIVDGRQPQGLSISNLLAESLPLTWREQRARFLDAG